MLLHIPSIIKINKNIVIEETSKNINNPISSSNKCYEEDRTVMTQSMMGQVYLERGSSRR